MHIRHLGDAGDKERYWQDRTVQYLDKATEFARNKDLRAAIQEKRDRLLVA